MSVEMYVCTYVYRIIIVVFIVAEKPFRYQVFVSEIHCSKSIELKAQDNAAQTGCIVILSDSQTISFLFSICLKFIQKCSA